MCHSFHKPLQAVYKYAVIKRGCWFNKSRVYVCFLQEFSGSSPKRRRAEEKDEGIGSPDTMEEEKMEELRREILELRQQLDKERSARMQVEDQVNESFRPRGQRWLF